MNLPSRAKLQSLIRTAGLVVLFMTGLSHAQELVTLPVRDGASQSFLLLVPRDAQPVAAVVLFPGGPGSIRLRSEGGEIKFGQGNFLVRSRGLFSDRGVATVVMDAPSDQSGGMDDAFRLGDKHAADIAAVVADVKKRFPNIPVYLVGTSRGTISAANGARALGSDVAGVILTSTLFFGPSRYGNGLAGFDYAKITAPLLLVHHVRDGCKFTPYRSAKSLSEARNYPLISVDGGSPATSDACEAQSPHGYLGKEAETVEAMVNWALKKPFAANIN